MSPHAVALLSTAVALAASAGSTVADARRPTGVVHVAFVGCPSDGQQGPQPAPTRGPTPLVERSVAPRLAFYAAIDGPGTLAPRGWHCVGVYGSNGEGLLVSRAPLASRDLADGRRRIAGEAVEVTHSFGGTSGRWAVAQAIARYFPARRGFLRSAFEGLDPGPLPRGSFRHDRLGQHSRTLMRYITPAQEPGQGTQGSLAPSALPVRGVVRLVETSDGPDLLTVASRLGARDAGLAGIISANAR